MLATNTSSLSVTALAAGVPGPERVVGMHFFNPPPVMELLEVVAGERSGEAALARARAAGEAMGKHVIDAADGAGLPGEPLQPAVRPRGAAARASSGSPRPSRSTASAAWPAASGWARSS